MALTTRDISVELKEKLREALVQSRHANPGTVTDKAIIPRSASFLNADVQSSETHELFEALIANLPVDFEQSADEIIQHIVDNFRLNEAPVKGKSETEGSPDDGFVELQYEVIAETPRAEPKKDAKKNLDVTLSRNQFDYSKKNAGGSMQDLSGYKDLSKPPVVGEEEETEDALTSPSTSPLASSAGFDNVPALSPGFNDSNLEADTEFSNNVRTLIRLVNDLPEGVTKQTGAQIIRLTMEATGISMEDVLTEAQTAQSEMLDAVRANIKKIEEYKTVIRRLESDIKYYQGKANELSEIIDLFILSNTSPKVPNVDEIASE